jgi:three-Cys-motif partner protein
MRPSNESQAGLSNERESMNSELRVLKQVSKAKHIILAKYLRPWSNILGSRHRTLVYVDCFAGPGKYSNGEPGSPVIALRSAKRFLERNQNSRMVLVFTDKDQGTLNALRTHLEQERPFPSSLTYHCIPEDARDFVQNLLMVVPNGIPTFFFIDPYGHPLSIPTTNAIVGRRYTEAFVNLMWFRINMDLGNPKKHSNLDGLFGHGDWIKQSFLHKSGEDREKQFLEYLTAQFRCSFRFPFRIRYSPEDRVRARESRTKYYLIHLSQHPKAALLMKEIMFPLGDQAGTFDYSATRQQDMFLSSPAAQDLKQYLINNYCGKGIRITFDDLREQTYSLPFIEKHYRSATKELENERRVTIYRIHSKKMGLKGSDIIQF